MHTVSVRDVTNFLTRLAPLELAAEWDNVGLLLGDEAAAAERIMTCLTLTPESADEAVAQRADLVVTHHPILFRGVKSLSSRTTEGGMIYRLARAGVAVYSPHTAFDNAAGGINDLLARRFELAEVGALQGLAGPAQCKVVVFVPDADLLRVSNALFDAGAGVIGQYRECSYRLSGTGTFFGSDAANPAVGQKGRREEVSEWRLEVLCPQRDVDRAIKAMRQAHSYEEPAFDVYPLRPGVGPAGIGRKGRLVQPQALADFARFAAARLGVAGLHVVGDGTRAVNTVGIVCGAGGDVVSRAAGMVDVLVTGEARFHDTLAAQARGLALVLPGHYATERCGIEELASVLAKEFPQTSVWPSLRESDPLRWLGA